MTGIIVTADHATISTMIDTTMQEEEGCDDAISNDLPEEVPPIIMRQEESEGTSSASQADDLSSNEAVHQKIGEGCPQEMFPLVPSVREETRDALLSADLGSLPSNITDNETIADKSLTRLPEASIDDEISVAGREEKQQQVDASHEEPP